MYVLRRSDQFSSCIKSLSQLLIRRKCLAMSRARYQQQFLERVARRLPQPFRQRRWHTPVFTAGDEQNGSVNLTNCGLNIAVVGIQAHAHCRHPDNEIRDWKGRQSEKQFKMVRDRLPE